MGNADYFKHHDWNAICDVCGFKFKASQLRKRWDGAMVCKEDWEPRHPQDFIRAIKENIAPPWTRPEATDIELTGYVEAYAGATTITSADLGTDNRVVVAIIEQEFGTTQGAVTVTINNTVGSGDTVIISGTTSKGVSVTVVDNSTGATVTQIA